MIKVKNWLIFFFSSRYFLEEIKKTCSQCFYQVTETLVKVWKNLKKLWKHLPVARVPTAFLFLPTGAQDEGRSPSQLPHMEIESK